MSRYLLAILAVLSIAIGQSDSDTAKVKLPDTRPESYPSGEEQPQPFFDYKYNLDALQQQIDSLKAVVRVYQKNTEIPPVDKKLLDMIPIPENQQRIILQNGTVVVGTVTGESGEEISLQTSLGRLVIRKNLVVRVDQNYGVHADVKIIGDPKIDVYPEREIVTGLVKNTGQKRADFVRVIAELWTSTTKSAGRDSSFIDGRQQKYESGVISDTALEPGETARFRIVVPIQTGQVVEYRTQQPSWTETN